MLTSLLNCFTKENITIFIAIFSFILSLWNFFKSLWDNRSKVHVDFKSCCTGKTGKRNIIYFELSIENCSTLPIAISRIFLETDKKQFEFSWIPEIILEKTNRTNNAITNQEKYYSEKIPHTIDGLGVWGGFFFLETPIPVERQTFINSKNYLVLRTNRGIKKIKISINPDNVK